MDDVITSDWKLNNSHACNCLNSTFCDPHHKHIVTGDLRFIENGKLRSLLCNGPGYREPRKVFWRKFLKDFSVSLKNCISRWAAHERVSVKCLREWKMKVLEQVKRDVNLLMKKRHKKPTRTILSSPHIKTALEELQRDFVFVRTDKASNNIAIVCKKFYVEKSMQELGIFSDDNRNGTDDKTYVVADLNKETIM